MLWLLVMPPIFFFFIGTVTGGFASSMGGGQATPVTVVAESPGFLRDQITLRLEENDFAPEWVSELVDGGEPPPRLLEISPDLSKKIRAGEQVDVRFDTRASALSRDFEIIRVQRGLYTALADIIVADASRDALLSAEDLLALNERPRIWKLEVSSAGERQEIPTGFEQAIPGILVMFTLLVLLTSGGTLLVAERQQGLLRRLASAPVSRQEVVAGKWGGRMALAAIQVTVALSIGTVLFRMDWGPDLAMVVVILAAWAGFCASAGLLLGSIAKTEGQAGGLGVLAANALAALGGCWWPIEVTPPWMQTLQHFMPTGWTMNALHKLISFQSGAVSAVPQLAIILAATLAVAALAVKRFRYE